jgi:uncharacterized protein YjbI with pentapeptide repeats/voltage-gated potassium channel Kch
MKKEEKHSTKCPICGRPTHKESKYCIFHASAEDKTEREFKEALKEHVDKIKKEDGDYDFEEFIFVGNIDFKEDLNIDVFKDANFIGVTFEGNADFSGATFKGDANFVGATFKGDADLSGATFKGHPDFYHAKFRGTANFSGATFEEDADFKLSYIENIGNTINFSKIRTFSGKRLYIRILNVKGEINFNHACLENTELDIEIYYNVLIDFQDALLGNTKIIKLRIENHILQEKENNYYHAKGIYFLLKKNFHSIGQYEDESWAFKKEKDMERKSYYSDVLRNKLKIKEKKNKEIKKNFHSMRRYGDESWAIEKEKDMERKSYYSDVLRKKLKIKEKIDWEIYQEVAESISTLHSNLKKIKDFGKWVWSCFCNAIYGYGERPWNVIISAGLIIVIFALLFSSIGISKPEIIELNTTTIQQNPGNIADLTSEGLLKNNVIKNFPDSLYFSLITFTTLGYGDFRPLEGLGRILAGSEAFIGAFMMALFVYTFARRTGGR